MEPILSRTSPVLSPRNGFYEELTTNTTFEVYSKATTNATALNGGFGLHADDVAAGRTGYILVEVCYIRPDTAVAYADMEQYLPNRTVS